MLLLVKTNLFFVVMDSVRLICEKSDSSFLEEVHTLEALANLCFEIIHKKLQIASLHLLAPADGEEKGIEVASWKTKRTSGRFGRRVDLTLKKGIIFHSN